MESTGPGGYRRGGYRTRGLRLQAAESRQTDSGPAFILFEVRKGQRMSDQHAAYLMETYATISIAEPLLQRGLDLVRLHDAWHVVVEVHILQEDEEADSPLIHNSTEALAGHQIPSVQHL